MDVPMAIPSSSFEQWRQKNEWSNKKIRRTADRRAKTRYGGHAKHACNTSCVMCSRITTPELEIPTKIDKDKEARTSLHLLLAMSGEGEAATSGRGGASSVVLSRLHTVTSHHASALASISTVSAAATETAGASRRRRAAPSSRPSALATVSHRRSKCSQPPLANSSAAAAAPVVELDLNPPERVPPHRIVPGASDVVTTDGGELPATNAARKAIAALAATVDEATELEALAERRILPPLALFGCDLNSSSGSVEAAAMEEMDDDTMNRRDAELLRRVGRFVPALQETFNFTLRCRRLVRNMVCQIGGCASPPVAVDGSSGAVRAPAGILGPDVRLIPLSEAIAKLLRVLIAIDETVGCNTCLAEGWELYKSVMRDRAVQLQQQQQQQQQQSTGEEEKGQQEVREELESFERLLVQLDFTLLSCRSFVTAIEQNFDPGCHYQPLIPDESPTAVGKGRRSGASDDNRFTLYGEVKTHVIELYDRCCRKVGTSDESSEADLAVGVYALYCMYRRILPSHLIPDAKLHRALWMEMPAKRPVIPLFANAAFLPREFLMRYAPYEGLRGCTPPADPEELRRDAMTQISTEAQNLSAVANRLRSDALKWVASADMDLAPYPSSVSGPGASTKKEEPAITVEKTVAKIIGGIRLARRASLLLRNHLISHYTFDMAIESDHLPALAALCEVVKSIQKLLHVRRRPSVISTQRAAEKLIAASLFRLFESLRLATDHYNASIDHEAGVESTNIARITACLSSLEGLLKGTSSFSQGRSDAIKVSLACCANPGAHDFRFESLDKARNLLDELHLMSDIDNVLRRACDMSFLYFHSELFVKFTRAFYHRNRGIGVQGFQFVCSAFSDASDGGLLSLSPPDRRDGILSARNYRSAMIGTIQEEIIVPICQVIDSELRLAALARSPQQRKQNNPKEDRAAKVRQLLDMPAIQICGNSVSVKTSVQEYLENMFYVMSAIAIDDNSIYSEMKGTALQFGLSLADSCLPLGDRGGGGGGGGADVVELSDNLSAIVQNFSYDMSQEIFVRKRPVNQSQFLACINVSRLALSIRQHGFGVVDRSVGVAYTLLWEVCFETATCS